MLKRRLVVRAAVVALVTGVLGAAVATPAQASGWVGQDPYTSGCTQGYNAYWEIPVPAGVETSGSSILIRDSSGVIAGYAGVYHSRICNTGWVEWVAASPAFHGELSAWNSVNQNQKKWFPAGVTYGRTPMIDDPVGVLSCWGMQVYYNGQWRRWHMGFCW